MFFNKIIAEVSIVLPLMFFTIYSRIFLQNIVYGFIYIITYTSLNRYMLLSHTILPLMLFTILTLMSLTILSIKFLQY